MKQMLFHFALEKALSSMMFHVVTVALLLAKTENWMMVVNFLIIEEYFLRAMIFRNQASKIQNLKGRIESNVSEDIEHIRIQIQRTVATHKYCCVCYEAQDVIVVPKQARMKSYV